MGIPTRNTMVVPCMVKSWLNVPGGTRWRPDQASWRRIADASSPATTRNTSPLTTYMTPSRLWSTVTTHSWSTASNGRCAPTPRLDAILSEITLMGSLPSPQGQEVSGHFVQVVAGELHGRHERTRLQRCRIVDPGPNVPRRVLDHSGPDGPPAHQMSQVGPEHAVGLGPPNRVAVDARQRREQLAPRLHLGIVPGRRLLLGHPLSEVLLGLDGHDEQHPRVLEATVLGALADIPARLLRVDPDPVGLVRDDVHLPGELGNPEAVNDISGLERDEGRGRVRRVADRHVELVGGDDAKLRVADLPPPLVPDDRDFESLWNRRAPLDREDVPGRHQEQDDDDQDRDNGPGQLDLQASVHLGRLSPVITLAASKAHDGVDGQSGHDEEDGAGYDEHDPCQLAGGIGRGGDRREDTRRLDHSVATSRRRRGREYGHRGCEQK